MSNTIPEGWEAPKLGQVFKLLRGSIVPQDNPTEKLEYYSIPVFDQCGSFSVVMGFEIESNKTLISEPAILVSKLNPRKPRVQVVAKKSGLRQCASTEFMAYAPKNKDLDLNFYKYYLLSEKFSNKLQLVATGSTNSHVRVTPSETLTWNVPAPPLPEQKKIAAILSSVDEVIEKTRAQIDKLKDLKAGMMQELLTKGIGHTEFKDSPVGRIPAGWNVITMESVLNKVIDYRGKSPPKSDCGIPLITAKNIRQGYIDENPKEYIFADQYESWMVRGIPTTGDIFITTEAPLGNVAKVPGFKFAIGQRVLALNPAPCISSDYLLYLMQSRYFQDQLELQSTGSTVAGIKQSTFRKILIPLPPVQEQQSITKPLDSIVRRIDSTFLKLHQAERMKKALMQDLLTGKVRVNVDARELADT
ncbi:restriction endonuclease subunit S [Halomonas sp. KO116]|uniref:restriction endonuclease subunit S n=1 Tax=Halomonas sp. KO116 TaxID=1504981 RepID=UPI0004E3FAD5|nr:restriction endonuclease subunit S [Halomonas sp. KO116]AJY51544.1 restriction modification system DNA specificity domain-containing protein [Halomonas sp. KO116]